MSERAGSPPPVDGTEPTPVAGEPGAEVCATAPLPGGEITPSGVALFAPGQRLAERFRVVRLLGRGGNGEVYEAVDEELDEAVALKAIRPELALDGPTIERFRREVQLARKVTHPNVCRAFDLGLHRDGDGEGATSIAFLTMELLRGETLAARLSRCGRLTPAEALPLLGEMAAALDAAHAREVVHRDFKCENVILVEEGSRSRAVVTDFGLARSFQAPRSMLSGGALIGTPMYMAPEQVEGAAVGPAADRFAFGVVMFRMLTGSFPFVGESSIAVAAARLRGRPLEPRSLVPDLDERWAAVILACLAREPSERPSSLGAVIAALGELPGAPRALPPPRRWRAILTVALLAIGGAGGGLLWRHRTPRATAITDLALPSSPSPQALTAYRSAMQAFRDGATATATAHFEHAVALDGELAAAHLRLALAKFYLAPSLAREHYRRAAELRATLGPHDQALLDANEPYIARQPADLEERVRRLRAAVDRFPGDADLALELARALTHDGDGGWFARAITLDPSFGAAYGFWAQQQAYAGDLAAALRTVEACLQVVPRSTLCLNQRATIDAEEGRCGRLIEDARGALAADPARSTPYYRLAMGTLGQGQPIEGAREAVALAWARLPEAGRQLAATGDRHALAILAGDFAEAEAEAKAHQRLLAGNPNRTPHALAARNLVELYVETGRDEEAAQVAEEFLRREGAYLPDPRREDFALARDVGPSLRAVLVRAGRLDPQAARAWRDEWLRGWRALLPRDLVPLLWVHGYAAVTRTNEEARAALAALPGFLPIPRFSPETLAAAAVGNVYLRAGDLAAATPFLRRAVTSCLAFLFPVAHTRAALWLGEALEGQGDRAGACAAYRIVGERWGRATPPSRSAAAAQRRSAALGCNPAQGL